jgi:arsenate reductase
MAEGLLRELGAGAYDVASAGTLATDVRPEAIEVMEEIGISIAKQFSKALDRFLHQSIDLVITVCDGAREACPVFPRVSEQLHWSIADPAAVQGKREQRLEAFRRARDELRQRIERELIERVTEEGESER